MAQQFGQQVRSLQQMLEVIQQQQRLPIAQAFAEAAACVRIAVFVRRHGVQDGRRQQVGGVDCGEIDEADAVAVGVQALLGGLDSQPRLADAARSDDGQQTTVRVSQTALNLVQFFCTTDEGRELFW